MHQDTYSSNAEPWTMNSAHVGMFRSAFGNVQALSAGVATRRFGLGKRPDLECRDFNAFVLGGARGSVRISFVQQIENFLIAVRGAPKPLAHFRSRRFGAFRRHASCLVQIGEHHDSDSVCADSYSRYGSAFDP